MRAVLVAVLRSLHSVVRSRTALQLEVLALRHQLAICQHAGHRAEARKAADLSFRDGQVDAVLDVKRPPYCHRLIVEWAAQGVEPAEIAAQLNDLGLRTFQGRAWSTETVRKMIRNAQVQNSGKVQRVA